MTVTDDRPLRISCVIITRLWLFRIDLFGQAIRSYPSCQRAPRTQRRSRRSPQSGDALADVPNADRRGQHSLMPQPRNPWQVSVDVGRNRPLCPRSDDPDDLLMLAGLMGGATYPRCLVQLPDKTVPSTVI